MTQENPGTASTRPLVLERLVVWYFLAALLYFAVSLLGGLLMAMQLVNHNPLRGIELLSPGRWRSFSSAFSTSTTV